MGVTRIKKQKSVREQVSPKSATSRTAATSPRYAVRCDEHPVPTKANALGAKGDGESGTSRARGETLNATPRFARLLAALALAASSATWAQGSGRLPLLGAVEDVRVEPGSITMRAKVDTGADNSSLGVQHLRRMRRKGRPWVVFDIIAQDGSRTSVELPVVRRATIRGLAGKREDRPTVLMTLCVAGTLADVEVTLADRGDMNYGMLLGRSFLAGRFVIDPGRELLARPICSRREGR